MSNQLNLEKYIQKYKLFFMSVAIKASNRAALIDEVPVGAVITKNNKIICIAHNLVRKYKNPTYHAEILAINTASQILSSYNLENCEIFVSLEPCPMCSYAITLARIKKIYFGAYETKKSKEIKCEKIIQNSFFKPKIEGGIMEKEASQIISNFFQKIRSDKLHPISKEHYRQHPKNT